MKNNLDFRLYPHSYAAITSNYKWKSYNYLKYLSKRIGPAIINGGGRFIIEAPPRHGKTEFISKKVPSWYLDTFPDKNIILTSYGDELASSFGRAVRNHFETNEHCQVRLKSDSMAANRFDTTEGGSMITAGIGGAITGRGGHLLICDDPIKNWKEASSLVYRQMVKDWFDTTFYTRQEPGATIILLMTRWHHDDLAGYLVSEHNDNWERISLPAIAEENDLLGRLPGEPLCPERFDVTALNQIKDGLPHQHWLALYQQRPTKDGGEIIKREWWNYYDVQPQNFIQKVQFWDTAQKPGVTNDYSVCATWGKTMSGYFLIDLLRGKYEAPDLESCLTQQFDKHRPNAVVIEDKSSGSSLIQYGRRKTTIPIIAFNPTTDKVLRAINASPTIKAGNCHLPRNAPWLNDFLVEHEQFPATDHDDQVDTTSMMVDYFNNAQIFNPRIRSL